MISLIANMAWMMSLVNADTGSKDSIAVEDWRIIGANLYEMGDYDGAIENFEQAVLNYRVELVKKILPT